MNATSAIVYCPRCRSRLRNPSGKGRFACPKCGTAVVPTPAQPAAVPNPPPPPPAAARPANALARVAVPPTAATDVSFRQYRQAHFRQTRGLAVYGFCAGLLLAPVISLAKPFLGMMGLLGVWGATVLLWAGLGALYGFERLVEYRLLRHRTVPVDAGSWTAACVYSLFVALAPVSAVVLLEAFSPPQGMLATLVPAFQEEQQRWLPAAELVDAAVIHPALSAMPAGPNAAERLPSSSPACSTPPTEKTTPSPLRSVAGQTRQMPSALADRVRQLSEASRLGRPALPSPREWLESLREEVAPSRAVAVEKSKESAPVARRWALAIGVNRYQDPQIPGLEYAVADARLVSKTLTEQCGYPADRILLLADDEPTEDHRPALGAIRKQLAAWLERADSEDTMLVFFSGHAFLDGEGRCYLAPSDARKADLIRSSLSTEELRNLLARCKATQKVLVLDCCHAGGTKAADSAGVSAEEAAKALAESAGLVTLASCRKAESSHEWRAQGQGLFTYFLCRGLQGAADHDGNGLVDVDELYRYTFTEVPTVARRELRTRQTPARCYPPDSVGVITLASVPPRPARPAAAPPLNVSSVRRGSTGRSGRSEVAKPMRSDDPYRDISLLCDEARQHHQRGDRGLALATIVQAHGLAADTKAGHLKDRLLEALSRTQNEIDDVAGAEESARLIKDPFRQASVSKQNALARAKQGDYEGAFVFAEEERLVADLALTAARAGQFETAKAGLRSIGGSYTHRALPLHEPTLQKIEDLEVRWGGRTPAHRPVSSFAARAGSGGPPEATSQQGASGFVSDPLCRVWDLSARAVSAHALGEKRLAVTVITEARDVAEEIRKPYPRGLAHELLALAFYELGDSAGVSSESHAIEQSTRRMLVLVRLAKAEWVAKSYVNAWELVRDTSHGRMEYFIAELAIDVARTGQIELARTILKDIGSKPMKIVSRHYEPALRKIEAEAARLAGSEPPPRAR